MNRITRWDPYRESVSLRNVVDRLFEDSFIKPNGWLAPHS